MKRVLIIAFASVLFSLSACKSKSLDDKYDYLKYNEDIISFSEKKLINEEDAELLKNYIKYKNKDSLALSKTYSDLIASAKKDKEEKLSKKKKLNESLGIKLKRIYVKNKSDGLHFGLGKELFAEIEVKNNSEKQINVFHVSISFNSSDGEVLDQNEWTINKIVKQNSKVTTNVLLGKYNNENINHVKLQMADVSEIKIKTEILQLLFSDGTLLKSDEFIIKN